MTVESTPLSIERVRKRSANAAAILLTRRERDALCDMAARTTAAEERARDYADCLMTVCHHLDLPRCEDGPCDDASAYDRALESMDKLYRETEAERATHAKARWTAESLLAAMATALERIAEVARKNVYEGRRVSPVDRILQIRSIVDTALSPEAQQESGAMQHIQNATGARSESNCSGVLSCEAHPTMKEAEREAAMPPFNHTPGAHAQTCGYRFEQYPWECDCGRFQVPPAPKLRALSTGAYDRATVEACARIADEWEEHAKESLKEADGEHAIYTTGRKLCAIELAIAIRNLGATDGK